MLTQTQETTLIDVKNKWVWKGCLEKDVNDDYLSEYVRKILLGERNFYALDHLRKTFKTTRYSE